MVLNAMDPTCRRYKKKKKKKKRAQMPALVHCCGSSGACIRLLACSAARWRLLAAVRFRIFRFQAKTGRFGSIFASGSPCRSLFASDGLFCQPVRPLSTGFRHIRFNVNIDLKP